MQGPYDARRVESVWYAEWERRGYFQPSEDESREPFVIAIPPPNITSRLHVGHVMFVSYQDLMVRWHRMRGRAALWIPGTDHAAIATQNVLERVLKEEGTSRHELGRAAFEERFWQWKREIGAGINDQLRLLGASVDWTREHFTLDEQLSRAVREAFVRLYEKGLIYRGEYLINWCPHDRSAISDLEVVHRDVEGHLWHIRYPLKAGGHLTVATTRPETMLGDTAIAVHPDDDRYAGVVGQSALVPGIGREIPVIADASVDREFGTGAVKVTPGHDPNDWAMGRRHDLPVVNIMNPDASLNANAGQWEGLDRVEARRRYLEYLEAEGLVERVEAHTHSVGHCDRDGTVVEPMVSEQWFVNVKPLADQAAEAARDGRLVFYPRRFEQEFLRWMENIQPWCISRQLWLGHRIPVWYCQDCAEIIVTREDPIACPACGSANLQQDPDVLDTWFSSGLWPFSTLGWPDDTSDLRRFYPTSVLETGYDILFFWVARMVMLGLEFTGEVPFHAVYLNGLMRHLDGSKVSSSKPRPGDDPIEVLQKYGSDAYRFMVLTAGSAGADIRLDFNRLEAAGHFANKLWNGAKFVIGALERTAEFGGTPAAATLIDRWITGRFNQVHADVIRLVENYQFGEAGRMLHEFLWSEFFDWYVEAAKLRLYGEHAAGAARVAQTLERVLNGSLRLLHPFMPFVTEEIWQHFQAAGGASGAPEHLIVTPIPDAAADGDDEAIATSRALIEIVQGIRNARHESNVEAGRMIEARIVGQGDLSHLEAERAFIERLARVDPLHIEAGGMPFDEPAVSVRAGGVEIYLPLAGMVDLQAERERLSAELADARADLERAQALLGKPNFVARAPANVVQRERDKLSGAQVAIDQLGQRLAALDGPLPG
jgi:valyl-tRNA synthetase